MSDQLFDHAVRDWLDDGSDRTPPAAITAVLLAVKTTPQERDLRIPRRLNPMPTYMRLVAGIALVAVLGVGAFAYFGRDPGPGGPSTPSPSPSVAPSTAARPSAPLESIDTSDWVAFASDRYGFSIARPPDWSEEPSDHAWVWEDDIETWTSTAPDSFFHPGASNGLGVKLSVWSVGIDAGMTDVAWIQSWCVETRGTPCAGLPAGVVNVETSDGHAGVLSQYGDTMAAFVDGRTIYVVAVWREEADPAVRPYGGTRRLLDAFLSTLTLPAESPLGSPAAR